MRRSESVGLFFISFAVSSAVAPSEIAFPYDLLILRPSSPGISEISDRTASGSGNTGSPLAYRSLNRRAIVLVSSMCGSWSLPTGTIFPLQNKISHAWCTGYVSSSPVRACPDASISDFTVGLRCNSASVTSDRKGSISSFSAGTEECVKIIVFSGSMPAAR